MYNNLDFDDFDFTDDIDFAEEAFGPFGKRKPLQKLLDSKEKSIRRKCKTKEACDEMAAAFKEEAAKFTSNLKALQGIAKRVADGSLSKADARKEVAPYVKTLKTTADLLQYGQVVQNKLNVTDDDIKFLSDYIKGLNVIIKKVKSEISSSKESFTEDDAYNLSLAIENLMIDVDDDFGLDDDFDFDMDNDLDFDFDL